jgi:hypothetical protein
VGLAVLRTDPVVGGGSGALTAPPRGGDPPSPELRSASR